MEDITWIIFTYFVMFLIITDLSTALWTRIYVQFKLSKHYKTVPDTPLRYSRWDMLILLFWSLVLISYGLKALYNPAPVTLYDDLPLYAALGFILIRIFARGPFKNPSFVFLYDDDGVVIKTAKYYLGKYFRWNEIKKFSVSHDLANSHGIIEIQTKDGRQFYTRFNRQDVEAVRNLFEEKSEPAADSQ